jgi:hypothetical protein
LDYKESDDSRCNGDVRDGWVWFYDKDALLLTLITMSLCCEASPPPQFG